MKRKKWSSFNTGATPPPIQKPVKTEVPVKPEIAEEPAIIVPAPMKAKPVKKEASGGLMLIWERALAKIESGEYKLRILNEDKCAELGTDRFDAEDEVLNWMLAKAMQDKCPKGKRWRRHLDYVKDPGCRFDTSKFTLEEILLFVSPQTEITREASN